VLPLSACAACRLPSWRPLHRNYLGKCLLLAQSVQDANKRLVLIGTAQIWIALVWGAGIMLVFFAAGTVVGILLGLRFKLFVLVPAILIATLAIVLSGRGLRVIVFTEVGTVALLQVGYIGGCVLRAILMRICPRKWFGFLSALVILTLKP
jgi:hypothetical protein